MAEPITLELGDSYKSQIGDPSRGGEMDSGAPTAAEINESALLASQLSALAAQRGLSIQAKRSASSNQLGARHGWAGEITTLIQEGQQFVVNGGADAIKDFLVVAMPALMLWVKNRGSRSITLKQGNKSAEFRGYNAPDAAAVIREFETDGRTEQVTPKRTARTSKSTKRRPKGSVP